MGFRVLGLGLRYETVPNRRRASETQRFVSTSCGGSAGRGPSTLLKVRGERGNILYTVEFIYGLYSLIPQ